MTNSCATPVVAERPGPVRSRHYQWLDSMRALAVLGVVIIHAGTISGANMAAWYGVATSQGRLGVRIFFMISAFLLYRPYVMAHLSGTPAPALGIYAKRRILRILPAYWVALAVLATWPGLAKVWTADWWIYFGVLQAYYPAHLFGGLSAAWSLTIEVAFYVVLPFLALFLGWLGRNSNLRSRMHRQVWALVILGLAAETFRIYAFSIGRIAWVFTLPALFLPFAVGMLLAVSSAWLGTDERRWRWTRFVVDHPGVCWSAAALFFVACCFTPIFMRVGIGKHSTLTYAFEQLAYVIVSGLLLLPAVFGESAGGWPRRILSNRFLCFAGTVSYGVFLWHQPLMRWMSDVGWIHWVPGYPFLTVFLLTVFVSILLGWASYRLVELPAMRLRGEAPKRVA